ncbi:hypothetical protein SDC9_165527 [bioreactor metagenome]|uniref:Uncharacterized protein n=1 Tax=bioreactor metagenome TaxID=1076179 RepID=A0A645FX32_9ZZZZ
MYVQTLHDLLGHAFGRAHDAGRINCFVGRDHDKSFYTFFAGKAGSSPAAVNIVADSFFWLCFHQRYMLVSSGMKNNLRFITVENTGHTFCVADAGNNRHNTFSAINTALFAMNFINTIFALAQQNQGGRFHLHYLAAKLGTN